MVFTVSAAAAAVTGSKVPARAGRRSLTSRSRSNTTS